MTKIDFCTPQYSDEKTKKAQEALIMTSSLLSISVALVMVSNMEISVLYFPLAVIIPLYLLGNYKFFYVERKG